MDIKKWWQEKKVSQFNKNWKLGTGIFSLLFLMVIYQNCGVNAKRSVSSRKTSSISSDSQSPPILEETVDEKTPGPDEEESTNEEFTFQDPPSFVLGQFNFVDNYSATSQTKLTHPTGLAVGPDGQLFLVDSGNYRLMVWKNPKEMTQKADYYIGNLAIKWSTGAHSTSQDGLKAASALAIGDEKMAVADTLNDRVLIWNNIPSANALPDVVLGQEDFTSFGNNCELNFNSPEGVFIVNNKLIVSDTGCHRVFIWDEIPTTPNQPPDHVLGQTTISGSDQCSGQNSCQSQFYSPAGIWSDGEKIYVVDRGGNRVLIWNEFPTDTIGPPASEVLGQENFETASINIFKNPQGITSDGIKLFVSDDERVSIWYELSTAVKTKKADKKLDAKSEDGDETAMNGPHSLAFYNNQLYVSDKNNHRVLIYIGVPK